MKGISGLPLDDDIVDRMLMFSPDFATLSNIILTGKAFYNVYKLHPKSIIRAVAYNVVGPALPQALRAIRYPVGDQYEFGADEQEQAEVDESGDAWDAETGEYGAILPEEVSRLVENAKAVKGLEEAFSSRHKDRRYSFSQLSFTESYRFQRAMYRIMLYCRIFYGYKYIGVSEDLEEEDELDQDLVNRSTKERERRKRFLDAFTDEQLLHILSVSRFLKEIFFWVSNYDTSNQEPLDAQDTIGDAALSIGPSAIYESLLIKSPAPIGEAFDYWDYEDGNGNGNVALFISGYLSYPITKLFEERKLKPPPEDSSHWKSILDSIEGEKDACARCNTVKGFDLWGPSSRV